jgi:rhodanese-related sulfurtransferase
MFRLFKPFQTNCLPVNFLIENVWLILIALISGGALLWPVLQWSGTQITVLRATQLINQSNALVVDVREPAVYGAGHLRDAKNVPLKELSNRLGELAKHKSKAVIAVCQSGSQSARAAAQLRKAGFEQAFSLEGGMNAWLTQGMPVAK